MSKTKVILLQNVSKVGTKYDIKEVASGYARNFLIASKKAVIASREALKSLEKWKEGAVKEMAVKYDQFSKEVAKFNELVLTIKAKANEEGNLYGAIHAEDIAEGLLKDFSLNIDSSWLKLHGNIKALGDYDVTIKPIVPEGVDSVQAEMKVRVERI